MWNVECGVRFVCGRSILIQHSTFHIPQKTPYFIRGGVADVMDGIMVLLLEEIYLERQDGEEFIDIATDVLDNSFHAQIFGEM